MVEYSRIGTQASKQLKNEMVERNMLKMVKIDQRMLVNLLKIG